MEESIDIYDLHHGMKVRPIYQDGKIANGYQGDQYHAEEYLKDQVYTISDWEIHSWSTDVYLEEVPLIAFNSVHFKSAKS